jgi:RpiB/LacA/LacB family sugar-phosphate isomerase
VTPVSPQQFRTTMKIALASDHAGFDLKNHLKTFLESRGFEVQDLGAYDQQPSDYPDFAEAIGKAVVGQKVERGLLICGSGVGASIAANKIRGIRAGLCHDTYSAHQGVEHDDMNVLVLGSRVVGPALAEDLVQAFLNARFTREERHLRRLKKVLTLEERISSGSN